MLRFLYLFVIIFLSFAENLFSAQTGAPLTDSEKNLLKFSRPITGGLGTSAINRSVSKFRTVGLDRSKVRIMDARSIINGAFQDESIRNYYYGLLQPSSVGFLWEAFRVKFILPAIIVQDPDETRGSAMKRGPSYEEFVRDTVSAGLENSQMYREVIVSFLAALEYRKNISKASGRNFKICLARRSGGTFGVG